MVGKGDNFRPVQDKEKFESEWDRIFGDKKKVKVRKKTPKHAVTQEHKDKTKYDRKVGWDANGSPVVEETEE